MLKNRVAEAVSSEDLLVEIAETERNIKELMAYHTDTLKKSREGGRWTRLKWAGRNLMLRRQIERHVLYWKLQNNIATDAYEELKKIEEKKAEAQAKAKAKAEAGFNTETE